ncbi:hypothetical protein BN128_1085 [Cronobacter sakazakii 696]|nr:hypothetical protein BN128_1085 [Cronobacter sakazakii 696]
MIGLRLHFGGAARDILLLFREWRLWTCRHGLFSCFFSFRAFKTRKTSGFQEPDAYQRQR